MRILFLTALLLATMMALPLETRAQVTETPSTHMWIRTGVNSVIFIAVSSLEKCIMLTKQASNINSSDALCYSGNILLAKIDCEKSTKRGAEPNCKQE